MLIDPTSIVTRDLIPLRGVVDAIENLPTGHILELGAEYIELQRQKYSPSARVIKKRLAAVEDAEDDEERLHLTLWAGLWIGEIRAFVLHPASNRAYPMTRSAWDPSLDSLRDLAESIRDGIFLGPILPTAATSLEAELFHKPILITKIAQRRLTSLKPASTREITDLAKRLVAEHKAKAVGPMLNREFVDAMLEPLAGRVSRAQVVKAWKRCTPRSWKQPGVRSNRRPHKGK